MAVMTSSTNSQEVDQYYERVFLERSKEMLIMEQGAQEKTLPSNEGKTVTFTRMSPLTAATTALTEGSNGTEVSITDTNVVATLAEYGNYIKVSKLLSETSIDRQGEEKAQVLGQNMGETLDRLARDELFTGATVLFANSRGSLAAIVAGDNLTATDTRKVVRNLKKNNSIVYSDGYFLGKVGPDTSFDLMNDSVWVNAHTYKDGDNLYRGELGKLHRVRFVECSANQKTEASTVTVFSNFFHGQQAFGAIKLETDMPKMYIKRGGDQDTSNPLNRFSTMGWAGSYVAKTLNGTWIYNLKTAAS